MSCTCIKDLIGSKFKIHGRNKEEGFDCWGVVLEVYKFDGITLPDPIYDNFDNNEAVYEELMSSLNPVKIERPKIKSIILFESEGILQHVGVYLGSGMFIHSTKDKGVLIEPLHRWKIKVKGYYDVSNCKCI